MFCIWWPAGFMVARLVVNNMLWAVMEHSGVVGWESLGRIVLEEGECA